MPYTIAKNDDGEFCVFKQDADGQPMGESLGCHPDEDKAKEQVAAIWANENQDKSLGVPHSQAVSAYPDPTPGAHTHTLPGVSRTVKAVGDWELDVLGVPFGDATNKDADGEYFASDTRYHEDKYGLPPVVYYHGYDANGRPAGEPAYIGKATSREVRKDGVWYRVVLDKASELAKRVWDAAQRGIARASSGSVAHLVRKGPDGRITEWPVAELSVFDAEGARQPANCYAVALPVAKAVWDTAGLAWPEAGTEAEQASTAAKAGADDHDSDSKNMNGDITMEAQEIQKIVAESVASALKAQADAQAAAAEAEAKRKAEVEDAVKAAKAEWEKTSLPPRLPGGATANVLRIPRGYDRLSPGEHALAIGILRAAKAHVSDDIVRVLAQRLDGEDGKVNYAGEAVYALKGLGIKSDEIQYSTLGSHGDEWVGVLYSTDLWQQIRMENWVLNKLLSMARVIEVPQGYESAYIPLESTDPTWYKIAEQTDTSTNRPSAQIVPSQITTGRKQVTLAQVGCNSLYTGELQENSIVNFVNQLRAQIVTSGSEIMEHLVIDSDTDATASTNINDIDGTPAATDVFLSIDGFRKLALVTNTANSRSAGTLSEDDFLETAKLLGTGGINALNKAAVSFVSDVNVYWKALAMAAVKTIDVWPQATLVNGDLQRIWGYEYRPAAQMHRESAKRMAEATGKIDQTDSDNTTGSILAVRWDQWAWAWKRRMVIETDRWIDADVNQIVARAKFGLAYRDTDACAISYNVTL